MSGATDRFWVRVGVGLVALPFAVLVASGVLWTSGLAVGALVGPDSGGFAGIPATIVVWGGLAAAVGAFALRWRSRHGDWPRISFRPGPDEQVDGEVAGRWPEWWGARPPSSMVDRVIVATTGVVVAAVAVWPFTTDPGAERWVGATDAPHSAWLGWRLAESVRAGEWLPTQIPDALWPAGVDVLLLDGLIPAVLTALGNLAGLGPYASYNLVLAIGVAANVWAGRALGRVLTDDLWVALACGVAFATAPALLAPLQAHVAFVWAFTLPLFVRRGILAARGVEWKVPGLAGLCVVAFGCSAYHLVFGLVAFGLVALLWPGSAMRRPVAWLPVGAALLAALVVLSPFLVTRWSHQSDEAAAGATDDVRVQDAFMLSADAVAVLTPPDELRLSPPGPRPTIGPELFDELRIVFPGVLLLAGAGVAWTTGRRGAGALVGTAGALWLLGLGPGAHIAGTLAADAPADTVTSWLPYRLLLEVPGLGNLRAPHRTAYALAAVLAGGTALGLGALVSRMRATDARTAPVVVAGITLVGVALSLIGPLPTTDLAVSPDGRAGLQEADARSGGQPGVDALVVVPFGCRMDDPRITALQIEHGRPTLGCSTSRAATPFASGLGAWSETDALRSLWCAEPIVGGVLVGEQPASGAMPGLGGHPEPEPLDARRIAELSDSLDVRYLLIDEAAMDPFACPWLAEGLRNLSESPEVEVLADDGTWKLVDLGPREPLR